MTANSTNKATNGFPVSHQSSEKIRNFPIPAPPSFPTGNNSLTYHITNICLEERKENPHRLMPLLPVRAAVTCFTDFFLCEKLTNTTFQI